MDAQLKKGILELCLLKTLSQGEVYGYDIIRQMHRFFPEVNESTFYSILRRLHKAGYAGLSQGNCSNGPARKYYSLSQAGAERLRQQAEEWHALEQIVRDVFENNGGNGA